jgi:hypothetical protein
MKTFSLVAALALLAFFRASAQVTVELALNQEQFLPGEPLVVAAKITNRSGRQIHLGAEANWLTFSVESADGFVVIKNSDAPVLGAFDLESSQEATKRVDLAPHFVLSRPGRYRLTATLRIKDWSAETPSTPVSFDIITGAKLWAQEFGVPATNGVPEMRKFTLEQASYVRSQMRLYVQLSDAPESRIYKTLVLGGTVSFSRPEAQIDRNSVLHALWQSGAQAFSYCQVNPAGTILRRETYDDLSTRPRLAVDENGEVIIRGGVRRPKPGEVTAVQPPVEIPATAK